MAATDQRTDWMEIEEAAQYLGVAPSTLYRWRSEGRLRFYRFGARSVRLKREDLDGLATPAAAALTEADDTTRRRREAWAQDADAFAAEMSRRFGPAEDSAAYLRRARRERERQLGGR